MRHEYRLVWMREGNTQARSKRFTNMKRLQGYLRALTATTAEERYGDKVDKQWHCSGGSGDGYTEPYEPCYKNCEGKTWRQKFEDSQALFEGIGAITEIRIESRELPAWTTEVKLATEHFEFGDIVRLSDGYIKRQPSAYREMRVMVIEGETGLIVRDGAIVPTPRIGHLHKMNLLLWTKADD